MPLPALLLLVSTLLPLAAFVLLMFVGKRMGSPLAGYVGTAFIGASFVCCTLAMITWYGGGTFASHDWGFEKGPITVPLRWLPIGTGEHPGGIDQDNPGFLDIGIFIDSLTITMFAMVTLIATLVHIFSIGYMHDDNRYPRFFTYLALFCFSMLGLILGGTLLQIFIFWELIGLCSYLLIGFWYEKKSATNAAIKAFIANRIGDVGMLIGVGILLCRLGNVTLLHLWISLGSAGSGQPIALADGTVIGTAMLTLIGVALFFGTVGKSAQFPLHVWLADAMEGPTPVSALIHAATMVAAGVYLLGRIFPILTPDAKLFIAIIGVVTLTMGALIAVAQTDIKKVLAFSTLSQLGYMVLAMGVGSWVGGMFHLITHAFFKALLFLAAGSVIHAAGHEQELSEFGGLFRKIPVTAVTFLIGVLTISGVGFGAVGFSGYYSKDMILAHAGAFATLASRAGEPRLIWLLFILPVAVAFITPFYMMRCWMLTFFGTARDQQLQEGARETAAMGGPLIVLAILAVISGKFMNVQEMLEGSIKENNAYCRQISPSFAGFATAWPGSVPEEKGLDVRDVAEVNASTVRLPRNAPDAAALTSAEKAHVAGHLMVKRYLGFWGFSVGLVLAFAIYFQGLRVAQAMLRFAPLRWLHTWLHERMYFDELYFSIFVNVTVGLANLAGWFDRVVVDGIVNGAAAVVRQLSSVIGWGDRWVLDGLVNGVGAFAQDIGAAVRAPQTGRIRLYVTLLMGTVAVAAAAVIIGSLVKW